jgi:hypothetical protein
VLFSFPSQYLVRYRTREVFSIGRRSASRVHTGFPTHATLGTSKNGFSIDYETITLYGAAFQQTLSRRIGSKDGQTHISRSFSASDSVCAIPLPIASTKGISIDF